MISASFQRIQTTDSEVKSKHAPRALHSPCPVTNCESDDAQDQSFRSIVKGRFIRKARVVAVRQPCTLVIRFRACSRRRRVSRRPRRVFSPPKDRRRARLGRVPSLATALPDDLLPIVTERQVGQTTFRTTRVRSPVAPGTTTSYATLSSSSSDHPYTPLKQPRNDIRASCPKPDRRGRLGAPAMS